MGGINHKYLKLIKNDLKDLKFDDSIYSNGAQTNFSVRVYTEKFFLDITSSNGNILQNIKNEY